MSTVDKALFDYLQTYLTDRRKGLFKKVLAQRTRHFTVVTEDVYQLHNTSAVMRSCDVFGIQDLYVVEELAGKRIDKEIAMGAQKWVSLQRRSTIQECISEVKNKGYQVIATTPHTDGSDLYDFDITKKAAFFFGKENDGLSDVVMNAADGFLKIPMYGFTESLNISVSAAIILQHVVTKLKQSDVDWSLTQDEKNILRILWAKKTIRSVDDIIDRFYKKQP